MKMGQKTKIGIENIGNRKTAFSLWCSFFFRELIPLEQKGDCFGKLPGIK